MTQDQDTVASIAGKLTEAQRRALTEAFDIGITFITRFESGVSAKALHRQGLTNLAWAPAGLTSLGLAVRNFLNQQDKDNGK